MRLFAILVTVLLLGALFIIAENNIHITEGEELQILSAQYTLWLSKMFKTGGNIAGNAVRMEWLGEQTESEENITEEDKN